MTIQLDIFESRLRRDEGIARAEDKAEKDIPGWKEAAFNKIIEFINVHQGEFMCEEIRSFAAMDDNFELPEKGQAWAGPVKRAEKEGKIRFVKWQPIKGKAGHGRPGAVWIKI